MLTTVKPAPVDLPMTDSELRNRIYKFKCAQQIVSYSFSPKIKYAIAKQTPDKVMEILTPAELALLKEVFEKLS